MAVAVPERLRKLADGMDREIQAMRHPAIALQNMTPRRVRIARGMAAEGDRLALIQAALRLIADAYGNPLKAAALDAKYRGIMSRTSKAAFGAVSSADLKVLVGEALPVDRRAEIRRLEQDLVGMKIPGFFPTPMDTGAQMAELARLAPGLRVLEPSAGKGDLAEAILSVEPGVTLEVCEINARLRELCARKGLTIRQEDDCLTITDTFDRIIQNPPFEDGLDMTHTERMFERLVPGGRLVGIVSEGPFSRQDKRSAAFREWLDGKLVEEVKLPSGTFTGAQAFRQTGVASRILVLDKE